MSKNKNTAGPELDIAGLLALKTYERPDKARAEKNIQNIMRAVRSADRTPSLLIFPDKSAAWMFAQPRYGVAALFILFLGLHMLSRPMPAASLGTTNLEKPELASTVAAARTNQLNTAAVPGLTPTYTSLAGEPAPLSSYVK
ncbi:MAG TPA: hypothetical protein PLD51_06035 [Pontiellaceae bacterium]|nr:hypothetical protein [Pontiellaceae bacterium]